MVRNKKINRKLAIKIVVTLLVLGFVIVGIIMLVDNVPSLKETLILATTVKPETFTELYFEDHLSLPDKISLFIENSFEFTIHNLENKDMEYPYEAYIDIDGEKQMIDEGSVFIKNNEYITITVDYTVTVPIQRSKVIVNLIDKNQQIHFWTVEESET